MKLAFKKILVNALVLLVVMLPLPALSMPIDMSADCMMDDMSSMQHEGHEMPQADDEDRQASGCQCCSQCAGDCTGCISMSAVTYNLLNLSDLKTHEPYVVAAKSLLTRITSPPSRPPITLYI